MRGIGPAAVALGTFDGVHLGHQALVASCIRSARAEGLRALAVTFDPHPMEVVAPERAPTLLTTPGRREELIAGLGVDGVVVLRFDSQLRTMEPACFVETVLVRALRSVHVHVGQGFTFGRNAAGTGELLQELGHRYGFRAHIAPLALHDGMPISSSRIRDALLAGDVEVAAAMLGRRYSICGTVVQGEGVGRRLGFATANLRVSPRITVPADGVYATVVRADQLERAGACSIGTRPTFGGRQRVVEVHLLDFDADLYGAELEIAFVRRLRDQVRYERVETLVEQMRADVDATRTATAAASAGGAGSGEPVLKTAAYPPMESDSARAA